MKSMTKTALDGIWTMAIGQNDFVKEKNIKITTIEELNKSGLVIIPANVPGNFELDMQNAGLIEDPFFGTNIIKMQELENRHIWYGKSFEFNGDCDDPNFLFEGIDTFSDIFLNGTLIGSTNNMLIPHEIKAAGIKEGMNEIIVHIKPSRIVTRDFEIDAGCYAMRYGWESLRVRKAPHMYGWDIMPRALSAGLWRSVSIIGKRSDGIDEIFLFTNNISREGKWAILSLNFKTRISSDKVGEYRLMVKGKCGDSSFKAEHKLYHTSGKFNISVGNAQFWWPSDLGKASLYETEVELYRNETLLDSYSLNVGIRKIELIRTSTTDKLGNGNFQFKVNGEKLFVKGTNWVPMDAYHSRDRERLIPALELVKDIGCNAIRCWGGNVYEDPIFYDFCDKNGIVIWQDFSLACAVYPQDREFSELFSHEVGIVIKMLRNHPSIILWAGDNECDYAFTYWDGLNRDPNTNVLTRKVIPDNLKLYDPARAYIPSSPYIDETAYKLKAPIMSGLLPEDHLWGCRDYFKSSFYTGTQAHFASEMGYHGCPSPKSIVKFISKDKLWPWQDNDEWIAHASSPELDKTAPYAYRIELMTKQIFELWGFNPEDLETFSIASQISQAEAFKFFVELFRSKKWRRTGIIWWNLIDGWPQFSDAVVDYYYDKKLAYHFIKRSQQPLCLMFTEPDNWFIQLVASNDTLDSIDFSYTVKDLANESEIVLESCTSIASNSAANINKLAYSMGVKHFYLIEWEYNGIKGSNHYLAGMPPFRLEEYQNYLKIAGYS